MNSRKLIKHALRKAGISITRYPPPHEPARAIQEIIQEDNINIILDVGAFHGAFCDMLRTQIKYTGLIVSFEPCRDSFLVLQDRMAGDKNWRGYQFGLGNKGTSATLHTYENADFNSLLAFSEEGARAGAGGMRGAKAEEIQLHTLDSIWDAVIEGVDSPRVFLKTDAQGFDTEVIQGASAHLECVYGIQSELPVIEIYEGMVSMAEGLLFYRQLGYTPVGFFPVGKVDAIGLSPEFDVVFKRSQVSSRSVSSRPAQTGTH